MDEDSHPVAMGSGMLIGMGLGLAIAAGTLAWRNTATTSCALAALEGGRVAAGECPPRATAHHPLPLLAPPPLNRR